MKWKWERSSGLIKEDGEAIAAVFGASMSNEKAYRNARLVENAPEMYRLLDGLRRGDDVSESEITAVLESVNGKEPEMPELKTCPFCGGEAEVYEEEDESQEWIYVRCVDCWARTDGNDTEIGARDAWNQRKNTR